MFHDRIEGLGIILQRYRNYHGGANLRKSLENTKEEHEELMLCFFLINLA